jgi:hypothetical protein
MCIYCSTNNYRGIFTKHHGPIPKDETGYTYEIHHIDGNHLNNHPDNLKAVSIKEHYDIHYSQNDWGACLLIASKMKLPHEERSNLASKYQKSRVINGTHPFLNTEFQKEQSRKSNFKRLSDGTHNFLNSNIQSVAGKISNKKRLSNGTHNFLGGEIQNKKIKNGTHHLLAGNRPKVKCPHCDKIGDKNLMTRWHFDRCKSKN